MQVSGPTVNVLNTGEQTASFIPSTSGSYEFSVTVAQDKGVSEPDSVTITFVKSGGLDNSSIIDFTD